MKKQNNEILEDAKKNAASFSKKMTQVCDTQGEKMIKLIRKNVPAVDDCAAKDPAKLSKTILMINVAATAIMLFSFYMLPAMPSLKGDGTLTLNATLKLFSSIANSGRGVDMQGLGTTLFASRLLIFFTFVNIGLGIYTLSTEKVIPYLSSRLASIVVFIFMVLTYAQFGGSSLIGIYIALIASIIVGISGFAIVSSKK